jgi:hypothetical protein
VSTVYWSLIVVLFGVGGYMNPLYSTSISTIFLSFINVSVERIHVTTDTKKHDNEAPVNC